MLYDRGMISCLQPGTGEPAFERQQIPEGKHVTSSPWAYDGRIFCLNEDDPAVLEGFRRGAQGSVVMIAHLSEVFAALRAAFRAAQRHGSTVMAATFAAGPPTDELVGEIQEQVDGVAAGSGRPAAEAGRPAAGAAQAGADAPTGGAASC